MRAMLIAVVLATGLFVLGAVSNSDTPLTGALAPQPAAACGFATFNAAVEQNSGSTTNYAAPAIATAWYSNSATVRVRVTAATGSNGQQWCRTYKYNGFGETATATNWQYMGGTSATTSTCDYIANSRTSHRGYFFRGTGTACATNVWSLHYAPSSYGQGWNAGSVKLVSCSTHATPYSGYVNQNKPHSGCDSSASGFTPSGMANGGNTSRAIFVDTVVPAAPTWTTSAETTTHKVGNTIYFRAVANTFTVTATHVDTATATSSGPKSYTWGAMSATTGWTGYTSGGHTTTGASTKTFTSSTTSVNATVAVDTRDQAGNDGTNATITLTKDAAAPAIAWVEPTELEAQAATSYTFDWTETDALSGVASRSIYPQTAPVTGGSCGAFSGGASSHTTSSYTWSGMTSGTCYRLGVQVTDNVGNSSAISYSPPVLVDTNAPTASITVPAANATVYRSGNIVYFDSGAAGSMTLNLNGSDSVSGFADQRYNAMGGSGTGWSPTDVTAYVTTNPYARTYSWTAGAAGTRTLNGTVRNNAGLSANSATLTLTPDPTAPGVGFNYPAGPAIQTADTAFTVDFNITEAGSGFGRAGSGWSLQRQRGIVSGNVCGTYSNDGAAVTGTSIGVDQTSEQTLASGYCYRWVLSATDSVGNIGSITSVTPVVVDETAADAPQISISSADAHYDGSTVYFDPSVAGSVTITASSSDAETGVAAIGFDELSADPAEWDPTAAETLAASAGAASKTYTWTADAAGGLLLVTAANGGGLVSDPTEITLSPDAEAPLTSFVRPADGTEVVSEGLYSGIDYGVIDADSGVESVSIIRQRATISNGACNSNWTDFGTPVESITNWTFSDNMCTRLALTAVDYLGNTSTTYSGAVLVDTGAPTFTFSHPGEDLIIGSTSYELQFAASDAVSGIASTTLQRQLAAPVEGSCADLTWANDGDAIANPVNPLASNGLTPGHCHRWIGTSTDVAGNTTSTTSLTVLVDSDPATVDFASPAGFAFVADDEYAVAWSESAGTAGIDSRSVQRLRAPIPAAGSCDNASWSADGDPTVSTSPRTDSDLLDGYCYRWAVTLTDGFNRNTTHTSPAILTDTTPAAVALMAMPSYSTSSTLSLPYSVFEASSGLAEVRLYGSSDPNAAPGSFALLGTYTSTPISYVVSSEGPIRFYTRALDAAGNLEPIPAAAEADTYVDTFAPDSSVNNFYRYETNATFNVGYGASDAGSGVEEVRLYVTRDGPETPLGDYELVGTYTESPISFTAPVAGTYLFYSRAVDAAGNVEPEPASYQATSIVTSSAPGLSGIGWTFADGVTHFGPGPVIIIAPDAPSGDNKALRASDGVFESESMSVIAEADLVVGGSWRLDGHGAVITICWSNGTCGPSAVLGDINGSTTSQTGWSEFALTAAVPADATTAFLRLEIGSDVDIDTIHWSASGSGSTVVVVQPVLSLTGIPASIDFGAGVPGDVLAAPAFDAVITTNNAAGYALDVSTSDLAGGPGGAETIQAITITYNVNGVDHSVTSTAPIPVVSRPDETTDGDGEIFRFEPRMTMPFVGEGTYDGDVIFVASSL